MKNEFKFPFYPPVFATLDEERQHRKQRLAGAFRIFSKCGFDEGVAGHITVRDPEFTDTFWANPFGIHFSQIKVSDLIRVNHSGDVLEGAFPINAAGFAIHSRIHHAYPTVNAAAHAHSIYGKSFSSLGIPLDPITQDVCAFYQSHTVYQDFGGLVVELDEGQKIADLIADPAKNKAIILQNHGLLTLGDTVDAAAWWFITMERSCQAQLLAMAAGTPKLIRHESAAQAASFVGTPFVGWFNFQPLYARIVKEQPDFLN